MHPPIIIEALRAAGLFILLFSGLHDFAVRTLPNWVALVLLIIGVALRFAEGGLQGLAVGLAVGFVVLLLTVLLWRFGLIGGGDVKLLVAAAVFVAPWSVPDLIVGTTLAGGVLSAIYLAASFLVKPPRGARPSGFLRRALRCEHWRLSRRGPLPYAAAIAAGGWIATLHV